MLTILVLAINECISTSVFASLVGIRIGVRRSRVELKICAITKRAKNYKSKIKKKKKKQDKKVLLTKSISNSREILFLRFSLFRISVAINLF